MPATCASYTYTLRQLGPRDEIVFKSVIRVLQGKTRHNWVHREDGHADLVLLGDQHSAEAGEAGHLAGQAVIHVNSAGGHDLNALSWPIRTADLVNHLALAGEQLARRGAASAAAMPVAVPASAPQAAAPASRRLSADQRMALMRWPDPGLLQRDMRFIKLATVLTGRPVNMTELMARSTCPLEVCQRFIDSLDTAGLLRVTEALALAALAPARPAAQAHKSAQHEPHGLLARIRQRLEMIVRAPAGRQASP